MKGKQPSSTDAELKRRLHEGDPAGDGSDLTRDEIRRMRQSVLREAESARAGRPVIAWRPALALASIAVVIALGWVLLRDGEVPPRPTEEVVQAKPAVDPAPTPAVEPVGERFESAAVREKTPIVAMTIEPTPSEEPAAVAAEAERASRQIRFTTSNGTQIIWVLDPEFRS